MTLDLEKQLDVMRLSPRIRQQIDEIRPVASERVARDVKPDKETDTVLLGVVLLLFAGFLIGARGTEAERSATDAFNEFWRQYVTDLAPSPEKTKAVLDLYDQAQLTHGQASRILGLTRAAFLDELGRQGLSPFQYDADEVLAEAGLK